MTIWFPSALTLRILARELSTHSVSDFCCKNILTRLLQINQDFFFGIPRNGSPSRFKREGDPFCGITKKINADLFEVIVSARAI